VTASKPNSKGVYFPGLNALRFFAAFAVIITHVELMKKYLSAKYGYTTRWMDFWGVWHSGPKAGEPVVSSYPLQTILSNPDVHFYHPLVAEAGPLGVIFFFVLSGFLITYLLFAEKEKTGTIATGAFYLRRIFRIWPLYYLILILGFFVLPHFDAFYVPSQTEALFDGSFWTKFGFSAVILPNVALAFFMAVPNIGQIWSIGVEEQFYLIWPWILRKAKHPLRNIFLFTTAWMILKMAVFVWGSTAPSALSIGMMKFMAMTKLECMALGGIGAWLLYHKKEKFLQIIFNPIVQVASYVAIPVLLYFTPRILQNGVHLAYGILFLIIILNVSSNVKSILKLEIPILHKLGKISFGIYMYHMIIVVFVLHFVGQYLPQIATSAWVDIVVYASSALLTIAVSHLSYYRFEQFFITIKQRYAKVVSGEEAKQT